MALPALGPPVRVAVATGRAFTFLYADTVDALVAAGAEVVPFDPLVDRCLPDAIAGLLVGGGFPEVHAVELADNVELLGDVAARVRDGIVTWAECGGLLWLARSLDGVPMAGVLPVTATMGERLTLGYRDVRTLAESPLGPAGHDVPRSRVPLLVARRAGRRARARHPLRIRPGRVRLADAARVVRAPSPRRRPEPGRGIRRRVPGRSIVDALLGPDARLVGVLGGAHLGDGVGDLDELGGCLAAGADDADVRRSRR